MCVSVADGVFGSSSCFCVIVQMFHYLCAVEDVGFFCYFCSCCYLPSNIFCRRAKLFASINFWYFWQATHLGNRQGNYMKMHLLFLPICCCYLQCCGETIYGLIKKHRPCHKMYSYKQRLKSLLLNKKKCAEFIEFVSLFGFIIQ